MQAIVQVVNLVYTYYKINALVNQHAQCNTILIKNLVLICANNAINRFLISIFLVAQLAPELVLINAQAVWEVLFWIIIHVYQVVLIIHIQIAKRLFVNNASMIVENVQQEYLTIVAKQIVL